MFFIMENPKMDGLGVTPYFSKPHLFLIGGDLLSLIAGEHIPIHHNSQLVFFLGVGVGAYKANPFDSGHLTVFAPADVQIPRHCKGIELKWV